jgi:hypothetical protein
MSWKQATDTVHAESGFILDTSPQEWTSAYDKSSSKRYRTLGEVTGYTLLTFEIPIMLA